METVALVGGHLGDELGYRVPRTIELMMVRDASWIFMVVNDGYSLLMILLIA